jgi:hypothetical protein
MEPAAGDSGDTPVVAPPVDSSTLPSAAAVSPAPAAPPAAREVAAAMEAVERDAAAIAESYASLFASLRVALSNVCALSTPHKHVACR